MDITPITPCESWPRRADQSEKKQKNGQEAFNDPVAEEGYPEAIEAKVEALVRATKSLHCRLQILEALKASQESGLGAPHLSAAAKKKEGLPFLRFPQLSMSAPEPEVTEGMQAILAQKAPHPAWLGGLRPPYVADQNLYAQQFLDDLAGVRTHADVFEIQRKYALATYRPSAHIRRLACCGLEMLPSSALTMSDPVEARFDTLENCHAFLRELLGVPIDVSKSFMVFGLHGQTSGRLALYEKQAEARYDTPPWRLFTYSREAEKKTK